MRCVLTFLCAVLLVSSTGCSSSREEDRGPLVLAASSLQEGLGAAADDWTSQGHSRPVLSFAGTSSLARQIAAGAQGDIFISADERWMDDMEERGLIEPQTRERLLGNELVLVAPAGQSGDIEVAPGLDLRAYLGNGWLAMADPDAVPAGRYGKQALQALGMWDAVSDRIASGENVRAALALVSSAEAPLGIVYATDAVADPKVRVVGRFPADSHAPMTYPIARLTSSEHSEAEAFRRYLLSEEGQAIFRRFGFETD